MEYRKTIRLKDGRECILRNGTEADGAAALGCFVQAHAQTDFLTTYPEESRLTAEQESLFLKTVQEKDGEAELLAEVDGRIVGMAGISPVRTTEKTKHRAGFGISIDKAYWDLGIGRALTKACIECAGKAGYLQLELQAVADNTRAIRLYESEGFSEYGRNPRGFRSRYTGWQELVLMRLELDS